MRETLVETYNLEDHARMTFLEDFLEAEESILEVNVTAQLVIYDIDSGTHTDEVPTVRKLQRLQPSQTLYPRGLHDLP